MQTSAATAAYLTQLEADGCSKHTIAAYRRTLRAFTRWLDGDPDVATITPPVVADYLASDAAQLKADGTPRATASTNAIRATLRAFGRYLVSIGATTHSPARTVRNAKGSTPPPAILTDDEQRHLLATLADAAATDPLAARDHAMFTLLLATGIRVSSLTGIDTADVRLTDRRIIIRGKGNRRDAVILNRRMQAVLADHIATLDGPGPLFRSRTGRRLDRRNVQIRLARAMTAAGIDKPVTVHGLRHTFGTRLYRATRDIRLVQRALHHSDISTTQIYVHLADDDLADALEAI